MLQLVLAGLLATGLVPKTLGSIYTQIDLSSHLNYDAVGTQDEVTYANTFTGNRRLSDIQGEHSILNSTAYTNQGSVGTGDIGLPDDGLLGSGKYQISTAFDNGTDFSTPTSNILRLQANNTTPTLTQTITLAPGEQGQYSGVNLAFSVQRAASASGYSSQISVTYSDATSSVILLTNGESDDTPRGTFGSNNFNTGTDSYTFTNEAPGTGETVSLSNLIATTEFLGTSGSAGSNNAQSLIRAGTTSIWEFSNDLPLDPTKTLQSIEIQLTRGGSNRNNTLHVFGATLVTAIPEPTVAAYLGLGLLSFIFLRRRRG